MIIDAIFDEPKERSLTISFMYDGKTGYYNDFSHYTSWPVMDGYKSYVQVTKYTGDIISGTFELHIKFENGKEWHITEGRFDIKNDK